MNHRERLTPDITIGARMPTPLEYQRHIEALEAIKRGKPLWGRWIGVDLSDLDWSVWKAIHQQGLVRNDYRGLPKLTDYGEVYLRQRTGASARDPRSRSRRRQSRDERFPTSAGPWLDVYFETPYAAKRFAKGVHMFGYRVAIDEKNPRKLTTNLERWRFSDLMDRMKTTRQNAPLRADTRTT